MASLSIARADRTHPRAYLRILLLVLCLLACLPGHALWRLVRAKSPWPRLFLGSAGWAAGCDVEVRGTPVTRNALYIANHVSWLDILVLAGKSGSAFVAKAEMAPWPLIGWLCTLHGTVFVDRDRRLDVHWQAEQMRLALKTGNPLTLFPEGTTGDGTTLLPFRSSLIAVATPPPEGVSIQPVAIDYGLSAPDIAWVGNEPIAANALRVMSRKGRLQVVLHFLPPLDPADFADRKAIAAHSREAIAARLGLA